jgi:putative endonuclease
MYFVYVLKSEKDDGWYIGSTENFENRLKFHSKGNVKSTKFRRPLKLIYTEEFKTRDLAEKAERYYKSGAGRVKLKKLLKI